MIKTGDRVSGRLSHFAAAGESGWNPFPQTASCTGIEKVIMVLSFKMLLMVSP